MNTVMNFKRMEVCGVTKDEALSKAPFFIQGDATQAFKIWKAKQTNGVTDADIKQFMLDYLSKKSKNAPGTGFAITLESAVADTRERPYTIEDVTNKKGARKYTTVFIMRDAATGVELGRVDTTKADAKNAAKALYTEKNFRGNIVCEYTKQVAEGENIAFKVKYTPSKSARVGRYLVFGVENA